MTTLITILVVLASIVLVLTVLVQKSKGGGLSSSFSSSNSIMGVRKTTDFLEKMTWGLVGFIMVMSILYVRITPRGATAPEDNVNINTQKEATPDLTTPGTTTFPAQ